ncbi:MAG: hypothetical protein HPKKFMNG_00327 [Planctomycetes bacterium]|nr:hypothetical protein [Planctomycetota bacterium]
MPSAKRSPKRAISRSLWLWAGKSKARRSPWLRRRATSGLARAMACTRSSVWENSVLSLLSHLRRAGRLKNRSRTSMVVPSWAAQARLGPSLPPSQVISLAWGSSARLETRRTRDTEAMLARASPRKPLVSTPKRSSALWILLVAWAARASSRSWGWMPAPLSVTRIRVLPASTREMATREAPASRAFSSSSLTTLAGRSTTSPAAILLETSGKSSWMRPIAES